MSFRLQLPRRSGLPGNPIHPAFHVFFLNPAYGSSTASHETLREVMLEGMARARFLHA
ncbi:hypothetical protein HMI54_000879 [Coelomomyces lativittatus]|nr:hypothetical protein HMI55_005254 [Coelomomyces lativittatus]KAJ1504494.1 hypothetical protein HMI56_001601 [Coelomomyces lativittatus]KAJ1511353.1 hypothetical protein HMI54_000879 [Coelomomyces lativittatus]